MRQSIYLTYLRIMNNAPDIRPVWSVRRGNSFGPLSHFIEDDGSISSVYNAICRWNQCPKQAGNRIHLNLDYRHALFTNHWWWWINSISIISITRKPYTIHTKSAQKSRFFPHFYNYEINTKYHQINFKFRS